MKISRLAVTATVLVATLGLAGCAHQPATRTQVCQEFDELGQLTLSANGLFDNPIFDEAGTLADTAGRYSGTPNLSRDASALQAISSSDQTSVFALTQATPDIASLCGHPFALGTTNFADNGTDSGSGDPTGNALSNGGNDGDSGSGSGANGSGDTDGSGLGDSSGDGSGDGSGNYDPTGGPTTTQAGAGVTDDASAQAALQQEVDNDKPAVEGLVGSWVTQLSSKTYGMTVNGVTYDYLQIWNDFESISQQNPGALLLWSGDYHSFLLTTYWVTIMPTAYSTADQANSWCADNGFTPQTCYAKLISHTADPTGSTVIP